MSRIVIDQPYEFVPPHKGGMLPRMLGNLLLPRTLDRSFGVTSARVEGQEKIREAQKAGHGILITPNHPHPADPLTLFHLSQATGSLFYVMASWHLFMEGALQRFLIRTMGAFSIYREGIDRSSLQFAMEVLESGDRPLVIFPEGAVTRTNDLLSPLMDGVSTIARGAARKRAKSDGGKVLLFPLALRYRLEAPVEEAIEPALQEMEERLSWKPQNRLPMLERVRKVARALLGLKEIEFLGEVQSGDLFERSARLIDHLLHPLEEEWLSAPQSGDVVKRGKDLRTAILKGMVSGEIDDEERDRRWRQFRALELAQKISLYPRGYLSEDAPADRFLETVERLEEDFTGKARRYSPRSVTLTVCDPLEVSAEKDTPDSVPLMDQLEERLEETLGIEHLEFGSNP
jgi:1-acyl-sn-glycerol-3-phosphate acyltransferase